jgi:hypothetical protein
VVNGSQKLAHEHIEAAVATKRDDLTRTVKGLDAVGLAERGPHRPIVEGTDDPLRSALPNPIGRPERVEARVEDEYRIPLGEVADGTGNRLRMDAIGAPRGVGLLVELAVPGAALPGPNSSCRSSARPDSQAG